VEMELRAGDERGRDDEGRRAREVARDLDLVEREALAQRTVTLVGRIAAAPPPRACAPCGRGSARADRRLALGGTGRERTPPPALDRKRVVDRPVVPGGAVIGRCPSVVSAPIGRVGVRVIGRRDSESSPQLERLPCLRRDQRSGAPPVPAFARSIAPPVARPQGLAGRAYRCRCRRHLNAERTCRDRRPVCSKAAESVTAASAPSQIAPIRPSGADRCPARRRGRASERADEHGVDRRAHSSITGDDTP
jgi:hypothetical protein